MPPAAAPSTSARSGPPASPLWTLLLGIALIRLVTAKRREPFMDVVFGRDRPRPGEKKSPKSYATPQAERVAQAEGDRGRMAESPQDIPAKGWKDILWRVYEEINNDRILSVAAGVTFYSLLALFPAIAALVSLYGLFADASTINDHLTTLSGFMPGGATEIIGEQVKRIASKGEGALGFAFFVSLAISLWSANAGVKAMFDALNIAYEEDEKRSFIKLNFESLTFTFGAILFIMLALGGIVVLPVVLKLLPFGPALEGMLSFLRWPILYVVLVFGLAVLYRYGPSRDRARWRWISWGSAIAAAVWLVVSMLFSWYVASFGNYNETYGSLGAAIGFMTWIWISTTIVLIGAEVNAEMEHQTAKDTTEGPEKPLGTRGAKMADRVGAAQT